MDRIEKLEKELDRMDMEFADPAAHGTTHAALTAREREIQAELDALYDAQAETMFEIEANFSPEETVVNVLTGEVIRKGQE